MTKYVDAVINETYDIVLPDFRRDFHHDRPNWERGRLEVCAEFMKPGFTVYDVGAEHGDFTTLYRKWVGEEGMVIPIEPADHYWPFIRETHKANGFSNAPTIMYTGLASFAKSRNFVDGLNLGLKGWCKQSEAEGKPDGGFVHLAQDRDTPRCTLDTIAMFAETPDAIVIDVEGAELRVLEGTERILAQKRPLVWVSWHQETAWNWYKTTLDEMHDFMLQFGYSADKLPHHGEGEDFWFYQPT